MSREYAEKRIKEALKLAKGNPTKARQHIIAWSFEDARLLQALAQPHMTGIVAHAINRVVYRQDMEDEQGDVPLAPRTLDMEPETLGKEILRVLQNSQTARFGLEGSTMPVGRRQASQSHIEAVNRLAGQAGKKGKPSSPRKQDQ